MEIKDFIILWTYSQWRQAIVVIPPLSREGNMWYPSTFLYSNKVESTIHRLRRSPFLSRKEHRFSCFPLISFRMLALCKKRTFRFTPVICKDCTILSREWHNHSCGLMVCFKAGDWTLCTILGYGLPERETCCILPVNQLSRAYFLTKWKKCNILSLFLQIHIVESTIPRRPAKTGLSIVWKSKIS